MKGEGVIVANDVYPDRLKALSRNVEQAGVRSAAVLQESPLICRNVLQVTSTKYLSMHRAQEKACSAKILGA